MKPFMNTSKSITGSLLRVLLFTLSLLLIPLIAVQFSNEVVWNVSDFLIAGSLLFATGLSYVLLTRVAENFVYKIATGLALIFGLFLIWVNLAVGLIGNENNHENLMYYAVVLVGMIGSGISHFKPKGMMVTMFAMVLSLVMIAMIALGLGAHNYPNSSILEILGVTAFFGIPFLLSGLLYRNAAGLDIKDETNE